MSTRKTLQILFGLVALAFLIWAVISNWESFISTILQMNGWALLCSTLSAGIGTFLTLKSWQNVLRAFGRPLGTRHGFSVLFIAQIGKYIPGGVWPIIASASLGRQYGIPAGVSSVAMSLQLLISVVTGSLVATGVLVAIPQLGATYAWITIAAIVAGVILLLPPVMRMWLRRVLALFHVADGAKRLRYDVLGTASLWSVASWVFFGLHLWLIIMSLGVTQPLVILLSLSGFALAWVVGFLAVITPAGTGVREVIMIALFSAYLPTSIMLGVAVVSRLIFVLVDALFFVVGIFLAHVGEKPLKSWRK